MNKLLSITALRALVLMAALLPFATTTAYSFEVDGIYYFINNNEAIVSFEGDVLNHNCYSGDVTIPASVTYNGITYPVTSLGEFAFSGCSGMISINIPNSVTSIEGSAFYGCSGLASITVATDNNIFDSRENCNAIIVTESNTLILGCSTSIIPNSVTSIASGAFSNSTGLTYITIPSSITSIGSYAFSECNGLFDVYSNIADPSSISMGNGVFESQPWNYSNRILHVPEGSVPAYQNDNKWNSYFAAIVDKDTVLTAVDNFRVGDIHYSVTSDSTVTVTKHNGFNLDDYDYLLGFIDIEIPSHVIYNRINYNVTAIDDSAFFNIYNYNYGEIVSGCNISLNITIPETVVSIGKKAFGGCSVDLINIFCRAKNPPIMNDSIVNCKGLINLFVSAEAYPLYEEFNKNNHYFKSIFVTDDNKSSPPQYNEEYLYQPIGGPYGYDVKIFQKKNSVLYLRHISNITEELGYQCFFYLSPWWRCNNLDSVYYYYYECADCQGHWPDGDMIEFFVIEEGKNPSDIIYSGALFSGYDEHVGYPFDTFIMYKFPESFDFSDSNIGYNIIDNHAEVTYRAYFAPECGASYTNRPTRYSFYSGDVVIPNIATYHNYYNNTNTSFPVTAIEDGTFSDFYNNYYICNGVYNNPDSNDYLNSVTLPASIESIGWYAFGHSPNLAYIKCLGKTPAITSTESGTILINYNYSDVVVNGSFDEGVLQNTTLYVPMAALDAYRTADGWKDFQHIVGFTDYDFVADGFYFKITGDNEVMVTCGEDVYQGVINIPTNVTYDGVTYDVTGISDGAFDGATLQSLILPVSITSIGNNAFNGCHIGSLIITGNGTWSAGAINCEVDNLYVMSTVTGIQDTQVNPTTTVYSYSTVPPTCNEETFTGYDAALHVPASALAAYFTAPYWNNFINITSDAVEPTGLTINKDSVEVLVGNQLTLTAAAIPADATPSDVIWTSSDQSIATITNGVVTAMHVGECDIKAYLLDKVAVCHVTVTEIAPTEVTLNQEFAKLEVGSQLTLTATVSPDDATDKYVTWSTTNSAVATVDSLGNVLAVGTGECFIIANCRDKQATCHIIVVDHFIFITLNEHEVNLLPNHMVVLTPSVMPENTTITVTSTNPNVAAARLANGKIQVVGITEGRTIIKVNSTDGYAEADSCLVKVYTLRGDVNYDGYVNISDVTSLINHLLGGQDIINEVNADANNDGKINISDVTRLINYLLGGDELDPKEEPINGAETFTVNGVSFTMLPVEGGTFTMGATPEQGTSDPWTVEYPVHEVTLSTFSIGETEVTQALWQAVMGNNPSSFTGDLSRPVEMASWDDCQQFIVQLNQMTGRNFRLPTEAEWEYAARGGKKTLGYKYAGSNDIDEVAWWDSNSCDGVGPDSPDYGTHPVASKKANELGLYDMSGNVWEWCQDWFGNYSSEPQTNPTGPESGENRVYRGGSWINYAKNCRVSSRFHWGMDGADNIGLRLVLQ